MYSYVEIFLRSEVSIMTFHTFEVGASLGGQQFKNINNDLKKYSSQYFKDPGSEYRKIFTGLSNNGIIIYLYKREFDFDRFVYYITYRVNPMRIMDETDYVNLFHSNNAYKIFEMVNRLLTSVSHNLPTMNECVVQRFDFCTNIVFENNEAIKDFIKLINASYIHNHKLVQKKIHDGRAGRKVIPKEEATFTHENYVEVSFYNKIQQLQSEHLPIKYNENILRCEIRCRRPYIYNLKKKFQINSTEDFFDILPDIGTYVYKSQLKKLNLSYTYLHLDEINEQIDNTTFKLKTKNKMKALSDSVAKHKGIANAIIPHAGNIIEKFSELNINPMPLPHRSTIPSGTNLLDLCLKFADAKKI